MPSHYFWRKDLSKYTLKSFDSANEMVCDTNNSDLLTYDANGTNKVVVDTTSAQTLTNKTLSAPLIASFTVATVTAAGSSQGDGPISTSVPAIVVVTAADTTKVVTLPASTAGAMLITQNSVTNKTLSVYPASGEIINALSSNTAYTLAGAKTAIFACEAAGTWFTILTA